MALSTITRHGPARRPEAPDAARPGVGRELRRRRIAVGMSQATLGAPFSRAYVSAVETGRVVPSLPALEHMVNRLGTSLSEFFAAVERDRAGGSIRG